MGACMQTRARECSRCRCAEPLGRGVCEGNRRKRDVVGMFHATGEKATAREPLPIGVRVSGCPGGRLWAGRALRPRGAALTAGAAPAGGGGGGC
eukprot:5953713-Pleurochrysis_carterae.AAC.1